MWWPGRELNPRRQPFQGCALPPELPGHTCTHSLSTKDGRPIWPPTCALTGRDAAKQNSRCAGTVRNPRIIATPCRSLKMIAEILRGVVFFLASFLAFSLTAFWNTFTTQDGR